MIREGASTNLKRNLSRWAVFFYLLSLLFLVWGKKILTSELFLLKVVSTLPDHCQVNLYAQGTSHCNLSVQPENKVKWNDKRVKLLKKASLTLQIYLIEPVLLFYEKAFQKDLSKILKKRNNKPFMNKS